MREQYKCLFSATLVSGVCCLLLTCCGTKLTKSGLHPPTNPTHVILRYPQPTCLGSADRWPWQSSSSHTLSAEHLCLIDVRMRLLLDGRYRITGSPDHLAPWWEAREASIGRKQSVPTTQDTSDTTTIK